MMKNQIKKRMSLSPMRQKIDDVKNEKIKKSLLELTKVFKQK